MKQVPDSCEEIINEVSSVKILKQNAASKIEDALCSKNDSGIEALHSVLKKAAERLDLPKISEIQDKIKTIQEQGNQQEAATDITKSIIPTQPHYFKIAKA